MPDYRVLGIHGAPRSGTTWLGELINSHPEVTYRFQPFFSYAFRDRLGEQISDDAVVRLFDDLLQSDDPFVNQRGDARLAARGPNFQKRSASWLAYKEVRFHQLLPRLLTALPNARFIGLVRDPRAVLASWKNAPREFDPAWNFNDEWQHAPSKNAGKPENWYGFQRWCELATLFLRLTDEFPDRFTLLRYADLLAAPGAVVARLLGEMGLEMDAQVVEFVHASTSTPSDDPYGVYRSAKHASDWRGSIPADVTRRIGEVLHDTPLGQFLD